MEVLSNFAEDIEKMSDNEKHELGNVINNEMQKAKIQESVHNLTDICFSKCVTGKISSGQLDRAEETCAQNCVDRFLDANTAVIKHLETLRGAGGI